MSVWKFIGDLELVSKHLLISGEVCNYVSLLAYLSTPRTSMEGCMPVSTRLLLLPLSAAADPGGPAVACFSAVPVAATAWMHPSLSNVTCAIGQTGSIMLLCQSNELGAGRTKGRCSSPKAKPL